MQNVIPAWTTVSKKEIPSTEKKIVAEKEWNGSTFLSMTKNRLINWNDFVFSIQLNCSFGDSPSQAHTIDNPQQCMRVNISFVSLCTLRKICCQFLVAICSDSFCWDINSRHTQHVSIEQKLAAIQFVFWFAAFQSARSQRLFLYLLFR